MSNIVNAFEYNFDGLVGPTHNYGGLAIGNLASMGNSGTISNPRAAALQGLQKMRTLMEMGLRQGVLPPHERPFLPRLRQHGFSGSDEQVLQSAWKNDPALLCNLSSAAPMWTANAATISPSADSQDKKVHFTPANLAAMYHRSIEHEFTGRVLREIFADENYFAHHKAVPAGGKMGDEGAANHGRFAPSHGAAGVQLFVYGRSAFEKNLDVHFEGRQALEASQAIARQHRLNPAQTVFARQSQKAIDAGAFHNDVVSVTNGRVLFYHQHSFENTAQCFADIRRACETLGFEPDFVEVSADAVSLEDAISSYLFNSQLITTPDGETGLILPQEAHDNPRTKAWLDAHIAGNGPIRFAKYLDLKQSMRNGGGPACLRLRVVLNESEAASISKCVLDEALIIRLEQWVEKHYRDQLEIKDLGDPEFLGEVYAALEELTDILSLGAIYNFQR